MSFKLKLIWLVAGLLAVLLTVLACAPAAWLNLFLDRQTQGRLVLGDVQGSLWNGSAFIGVADSRNGDLTPLLPGRFTWHVAPVLLLGQVDLKLENKQSLTAPVQLTGNWRTLEISPGALKLPSERLAGLGAPLNTLKPSGEIMLTWDPLVMSINQGVAGLQGNMTLSLQEMASALSPVKPLGSYLMSFSWSGQQAGIQLKTVHGPMLLSGTGELAQGHLRFSGRAQAQEGQEDKLANLLNLLGERATGAGKNVIALEFK